MGHPNSGELTFGQWATVITGNNLGGGIKSYRVPSRPGEGLERIGSWEKFPRRIKSVRGLRGGKASPGGISERSGPRIEDSESLKQRLPDPRIEMYIKNQWHATRKEKKSMLPSQCNYFFFFFQAPLGFRRGGKPLGQEKSNRTP